MGSEGELVIPLLAETSRKRLPEEFESADAIGAAQGLGGPAYFPAVEIDGCEAIVGFYADRIKRATDRLKELIVSFAAQFLKEAEAFAVGSVEGVDAVASADNLCDDISVRVDI